MVVALASVSPAVPFSTMVLGVDELGIWLQTGSEAERVGELDRLKPQEPMGRVVGVAMVPVVGVMVAMGVPPVLPSPLFTRDWESTVGEVVDTWRV